MADVPEIAEAILEGFDRHYRLFREISAAARVRFQLADWEGGAAANRERIQMYDLRVRETVGSIIKRFPQAETDESLWPNIKLAYVGLLYEHLRPELAETFFNSAACRVLHRWYYHNRYIFWRPRHRQCSSRATNQRTGATTPIRKVSAGPCLAVLPSLD
jgi:isocitrate dehydrogenase kinase/phosphatase